MVNDSEIMREINLRETDYDERVFLVNNNNSCW